MTKAKRTENQRALSVRLRREFIDCIEAKATRERRSMNAQFETIVETWIRQEYGEEALQKMLETEAVAV